MSVLIGGQTAPKAIYVGDRAIVKRYVGDDLVWQAHLKIRVNWNQIIKDDITSPNWSPNKPTATYFYINNGVVTLNQVSTTVNNSSYRIYNNNRVNLFQNKYYVCLSFKSPHSIRLSYGVWSSNITIANDVSSQNWRFISSLSTYPLSDYTNYPLHLKGLTAERGWSVGDIIELKGFMMIDLTAMYGAGNEPATADEFERQCVLNGIDLTTWQGYDAGTERDWLI